MSRSAVTFGIRFLVGLPALVAAVFGAMPTPAWAVEKASEQVSSFYGSFSHAIPIEVPGFRGLEPSIALSYSSEGRNGFVGVGWNVSGFSTIQRTNAGLGTPKFDPDDVYLMDGQELYPCKPGSVSPSCTTGGTHSTKIESYLKIKFEPVHNTWTVWSKDGTKTTLTSIIDVPPNAFVGGGTLRWGVNSRVDTDNNVVAYDWSCQNGDRDCYPSAATYNGYQVVFFKEARPDWLSWAGATVLGETRYRLRSIFVWAPGVSHIRAYKLTYESSALTGRSLLTSVQQYGKDLVHDGAGLLTGGTTLPAQTFTYQNDTIGKSFVDWGAPATPPAYSTGVTWANHVNSAPIGNGSTLLKTGGSHSEWDAGADSTYAIASGDGYVQWTSSQLATNGKAAGLSFGNTDATMVDIDYAFAEVDDGLLSVVENGHIRGTWSRADQDILRVEVYAGIVYFKQNGNIRYQSQVAPTYPLRVDASLRDGNSTLQNVTISGALINVNAWCQTLLFSGDFNGDGRTDQLCQSNLSGATVSLSSEVGFLAPTTWLTGGISSSPVFADFNNDGKTDIARHDPSSGEFFVSLSTGSSFGAWANWGTAAGNLPNGAGVDCRVLPATVGSGDFNGDGLTDVYCHLFGPNQQFIGLSRGSFFEFSLFSAYGCDTAGGDQQVGAIDFDGDGKDDWYCIGSTTTNIMSVFPSTGSSFLYPAHGALSFCSGSGYVMGDFNGDGRTDVTCMGTGAVALSTGRSFQTTGPYGGWCGGGQAFAADVDGDGASELVCNNAGAGANDIQVRKWRGAGQAQALGAAETWKANWCGGIVTGGDFNGDGKSDLYCKSTVAPALAGTGGLKADVASTLSNGLGGSVTLGYSSSTIFQHTINPGPKNVVTSLTVQDGRGGSAATSFFYWGGLMDKVARQFLGFRYARTTLPCVTGETACPYVETWFKQDLASAGKAEKVMRRHGTGNILSKQTFSYLDNLPTVPRTSLLSSATTFSYDEEGCANEGCASERSAAVSYVYDAYGNPTQSIATGDPLDGTDDRSSVTTYVYNPALFIVNRASEVQQRDAAGAPVAKTRNRYDLLPWGTAPVEGHLTEQDRWLEEESRWVTSTLRYSTAGNVTSAKDATNVEVTQTYDATYNIYPLVKTKVNPLGPSETEQTIADPVCGVVSQHTDENARVTSFQTDALCRPTRTDYPAAGIPAVADFEQRFYRDFGNPNWQRVVIETSPAVDGGTNQFAASHFDGLGRTYYTLAKGPSPTQAILTSTAYNARGSVVWRTAPYYSTDVAYATTFAYDQLDRATTVLHPDGHTRQMSYEARSQTTTDENGHVTTTEYDAYGQTAATERILNGAPVRSTFGYDALGRMTEMTDPLSIDWHWQFDSLGRLRTRIDPATGTSTYLFDDAGRMTRQTDAKGQWTQFAYNELGRLATKNVRNSAGAVMESISYTFSQARPNYFNTGRLTTVSGPGTTSVQHDYDARGRDAETRRTLDGTVYTVKKAFDASGRLKQVDYPGLDSVGPYLYDTTGRLQSIASILTSVTWDASGRPIAQTNANGTVTQRSYSPERGFLTSINTTSGSPTTPTLQDLDYTFDPAGLVESVTSPFRAESWTYGYDDLYRLTTSENEQDGTQTWVYDEGGRITYNSRVGNYSYGLASYAVATAGPNSYAYDANGSMISGAGRTITWNSRNLISQINSTQFVYDADGERLKKTTGASVSRYPLGAAYEINDGATNRYITAPGLGTIAKRSTTAGGTSTYWLHTDRLGSIQALSDTGGTDRRRKKYRAYGEIIAQAGTVAETHGWIGETEDSETSLNYLHARYYDSALGTFLSGDDLHPTTPGVGPHRYGYGFGDPVNNVDPSGRLNDNCIVRKIGFKINGDPASFSVVDCFAAQFDLLRGRETRAGRGDVTNGGGSNTDGTDGTDKNPDDGTFKPGPDPDDKKDDKKKDKKEESVIDWVEEKLREALCQALSGYVDIGHATTFPVEGIAGLGPAFGLQITEDAVHVYGGYSIGTPGSATSVLRSGSRPTPGVNLSINVATNPVVGLGGARGHDQYGNWFNEGGVSVGTPGASVQNVWVSRNLARGQIMDCK